MLRSRKLIPAPYYHRGLRPSFKAMRLHGKADASIFRPSLDGWRRGLYSWKIVAISSYLLLLFFIRHLPLPLNVDREYD